MIAHFDVRDSIIRFKSSGSSRQTKEGGTYLVNSSIEVFATRKQVNKRHEEEQWAD